MTTTVTIRVSGKVQTHVRVIHADGAEEEHQVVESSGDVMVPLRDPPDATFKVSEQPLDAAS
jgi:hypothetical protein